MPVCEVCQNAHAPIFEIVVDGKSHLFDSFECAIHALWPSADAGGSAGSRAAGGSAGSRAEAARRESPPPDLAS